jgi:hypothetical protein
LPQVVNLSSPVEIRKADGTIRQYFASADTDAARGTALATALTAHVAGEHIRFGPGTFTISSALTGLKDNTTLEAIGSATVKLDDAVSGTFNTITNNDASLGNVGITIRNLRLDGNNDNILSGAQSGIKLTKCTDFIIENNRIENYGRLATASCIGIIPVGCTDGIITGNIIDDVVDGINTSSATDPCARLNITNNVVNGTSRDYAINLFHCTDSVISGNVLRSLESAINVNAGAHRNLIIGNTILGSDNAGISVGTLTGTVPADNMVIGNKVRGCVYGILVADNSGTGNVIRLNDCRGAGSSLDILGPTVTPSGTRFELNLQTNTSAGVTVLATGVGATADNIITLLQALNLCKQS